MTNVVFSKTSKNKKIAFCSGYSYYFKSVSKSDPEVSFFSCTEYWNDDIKCMAKVCLVYIMHANKSTLVCFPYQQTKTSKTYTSIYIQN